MRLTNVVPEVVPDVLAQSGPRSVPETRPEHMSILAAVSNTILVGSVAVGLGAVYRAHFGHRSGQYFGLFVCVIFKQIVRAGWFYWWFLLCL